MKSLPVFQHLALSVGEQLPLYHLALLSVHLVPEVVHLVGKLRIRIAAASFPLSVRVDIPFHETAHATPLSANISDTSADPDVLDSKRDTEISYSSYASG
jgi:hypothetical protein